MKNYFVALCVSSLLAQQSLALDPMERDDLESSLLTQASSQMCESKCETSAATQEDQPESWSAWSLRKACDAAQVILENGGRGAIGCTTMAYGTPYLTPVVSAAGEFADWGTCSLVTAATGCYPLGWIAGKLAKTGTMAAGHYIAPTVAFTVGYYGVEIAQGAVTGAGYLYSGAKALYNLF